jgi:4-amino-4-deoxy-L-arabinose transferase-like glycosyltransferase
MWAAIATGLLLKGLIAAVFPLAAAMLYLVFTRQWKEIGRLRVFEGVAIVLIVAAPWHVLATVRNPPYFDLTPKSEPGQYHGFFLVLLPQRACVPIPEHAISARLQHRAAIFVLAVPSLVAVSVERVLSRAVEVVI